MDVHVDLPRSRAHHIVNIVPGTREDVAEGLLRKLAGGYRLLAMGVIPPPGWIQPTDQLGPLLPLEPFNGHLLSISPFSAMVFSMTSQAKWLFPYSPGLTPE